LERGYADDGKITGDEMGKSGDTIIKSGGFLDSIDWLMPSFSAYAFQ
jgi:hypothetical protein